MTDEQKVCEKCKAVLKEGEEHKCAEAAPAPAAPAPAAPAPAAPAPAAPAAPAEKPAEQPKQ